MLQFLRNITAKQKLIFMIGIAGAAIGLSILSGGILLRGAIVAFIITLSGLFTISRLPDSVRTWMLKHPLVTNLVATSAAGMLIGLTTVTGLIACVMTFLFVDISQSAFKALKDMSDEESEMVDTAATVTA